MNNYKNTITYVMYFDKDDHCYSYPFETVDDACTFAKVVIKYFDKVIVEMENLK